MITPMLLMESPLFCLLGNQELAALANTAEDVLLSPGEYLAMEGDRLKFFVVLGGELAPTKANVGPEVVLTHLTQGDWFGEMSALFGVPSQSAFRATRPSRVAQFDAMVLQRLVQGSSACGATIMKTLKERLATSEKYALNLPRRGYAS